jgi:putative ABC transport system permease protein
MLGKRLAKTLGVKQGDRVVWKARALGREGGGAIQAVYLEVQAILSTGNPAIDGAAVFIPIDYMRQSLLADGRATSVAARLDDGRRLDQVKAAAQALLAPLGFEVKTWEDLGTSFIELHRLKKTGNAIMLGVFLFIITVGIVNTMLMATYERVREIGMLMALGLKKSEIRRLFLAEGAALGLVGSLLGIVLAAPLMWAAQKYGIPIDIFTGGADVDLGYPIRGVMYGELSLELLLFALALGVLLSMIASWFPAWRASRLDPTEALRHV